VFSWPSSAGYFPHGQQLHLISEVFFLLKKVSNYFWWQKKIGLDYAHAFLSLYTFSPLPSWVAPTSAPGASRADPAKFKPAAAKRSSHTTDEQI